MSVVVEFPLNRVAPTRAGRGGSAEVVIFPGVRIERREFSLSDRIASPRKRRSGRAQAMEDAVE
jgi:hypothetical protein